MSKSLRILLVSVPIVMLVAGITFVVIQNQFGIQIAKVNPVTSDTCGYVLYNGTSYDFSKTVIPNYSKEGPQDWEFSVYGQGQASGLYGAYYTCHSDGKVDIFVNGPHGTCAEPPVWGDVTAQCVEPDGRSTVWQWRQFHPVRIP